MRLSHITTHYPTAYVANFRDRLAGVEVHNIGEVE